MTFHAKRRTKTKKTNVVSERLGEVRGRKTEQWNNLNLMIPALPPTSLTNCRIIRVEYFVAVSLFMQTFESDNLHQELLLLQLVCSPRGPAFELAASAPVVIGTVPLRSVQHLYSRNQTSNASCVQPPSYDHFILQENIMTASEQNRECTLVRYYITPDPTL